MNALVKLTLGIALMLIGTSAIAADKPAKGKPVVVGEKRELLSEHKTVARLTGIADRKCMGRTSLCPDNCGHSGSFATFEIVAYVSYRKLGQYGDPEAQQFIVQIEDNHKNPKLPAEQAEKIRALAAGDYLLLDWNHDYVTKTEKGGSSSSPERPLTRVEKISKEDADKLAKKAGK